MRLDLITHYPGTKTPRPFNGANQVPSTAGFEFNDILSAFQTQPAKNTFKTRGLTIIDYRARPVISKSRCWRQAEPVAAEWKNTVTNQFTGQRPSAALQKETSKAQPPGDRGIKATDPIEESEVRTDPKRTDLTEQQIIEQKVRKAAEKYNLPPELISAVIRAESNFNAQAVSSAGAQGLMQLMPETARELGVENPFDIEQNIDGGARYLRNMLDRFGGSLRKALAAYNAGPGTVSKYDGRVPYPETRQYVQRVLRFSRQIA
jgi:soluble lytic murein transglycosylase-like protein